MEIELFTEPFHHMFVRDLFTEEERKLMLSEFGSMNKAGAFLNPSETGTAHDVNGTVLKSNRALFLDTVYSMREASITLKTNRRLLDVLMSEEASKSWFFSGAEFCKDDTLISYYENEDYYESHRDSAMVTAVTWMFEEPKRFRGGNISFTDHGIDFEVDNKTTIVFPSNTNHAVSKIEMDDKDLGKGLGRYCMSQFLSSC